MFDLEGTGSDAPRAQGGRTDATQPQGQHDFDWGAHFKRLSAEIQHTPKDLEGHHTDKQRCKRLLALRDARKRDEELASLEQHSTKVADSLHSKFNQKRPEAGKPRGSDPERKQDQQLQSPSTKDNAQSQLTPSRSQLGPTGGATNPQLLPDLNLGIRVAAAVPRDSTALPSGTKIRQTTRLWQHLVAQLLIHFSARSTGGSHNQGGREDAVSRHGQISSQSCKQCGISARSRSGPSELWGRAIFLSSLQVRGSGQAEDAHVEPSKGGDGW